MAKAHLEITGAFIRVGPDNWTFGSTEVDYDFGVDLVGTEGVAILKGLTYPGFNHGHRDAIRAALLAHGFKFYARHRHIEGRAAGLKLFRL